MTKARILHSLLIVCPALVVGCSHSHYRTSSGAVSPGLSGGERQYRNNRTGHNRVSHNGADPNAPFTLVSRSQVGAAVAGVAAQPGDAANVKPCRPEDLDVVEVAEQVNGDARFVSLAFVNGGAASCKLGGYPTLELLDDKGSPVGSLAVVEVADRAEAGKASAVTAATGVVSSAATSSRPIELVMAPSGEAYFGVSWMSGEECPVVSRLAIGAPGSTHTFPINHRLTVCSGEVRVTALRPTQNAG